MIQHITFHLGDSLPKDALERLEASIVEMPEDERMRRRRQKYEILLDTGHGSCVLRNPEAAKVVQGALLHFNDERYRQRFGTSKRTRWRPDWSEPPRIGSGGALMKSDLPERTFQFAERIVRLCLAHTWHPCCDSFLIPVSYRIRTIS